MKYLIKPLKKYKKDYKRLVRSGKDVTKLMKVINILAKGKKLDTKHKDHPLKGNLKGKRECHITSDWLLLYEKNNDELILILISTGDHRRVLGIE